MLKAINEGALVGWMAKFNVSKYQFMFTKELFVLLSQLLKFLDCIHSSKLLILGRCAPSHSRYC